MARNKTLAYWLATAISLSGILTILSACTKAGVGGTRPSEVDLVFDNGFMTVKGKTLPLGAKISVWREALGPADSLPWGQYYWKDLRIMAHGRRNACRDFIVEGASASFKDPDTLYSIPPSAVRLEGCIVNPGDIPEGNQMNCGLFNDTTSFVLEKGKPFDSIFDFEGVDDGPGVTFSVGVGKDGRVTYVEYSLSGENRYLLGLERSPADMEAFRKSGGCDSLPPLERLH